MGLHDAARENGRHLGLTILGGAGGSVALAMLARAGRRTDRAVIGFALAGAVGAAFLPGKARRLALGIAATAAGHLALAWLEWRWTASAAREAPPVGGSIAEAFERARGLLETEQVRARLELETERAESGSVPQEDGHGVAVDDAGGGDVPPLPERVGDPQRGGARGAPPDRGGAARDAALHEGRAASLCGGAGAALPWPLEWDAWTQRGGTR